MVTLGFDGVASSQELSVSDVQAVADGKKSVTDEDILALLGDEANQTQDLWNLVDLQVSYMATPQISFLDFLLENRCLPALLFSQYVHRSASMSSEPTLCADCLWHNGLADCDSANARSRWNHTDKHWYGHRSL